jgi:hypothetical protein
MLELSSDEYHADPCDTPSLSSTIARVLINRTPAHAKAAHPRLSDVPLEPKTSDAMDMGTAVHQILLRDDRIDVADEWDNYRTRAAQDWRSIVRSIGRVPMLRHQWERAVDVADAIRDQMRGLDEPTPFTHGTPEQTITWQDTGGAMCRARLDWLHNDMTLIDDLKVTSKSADPVVWQKQIWSMGYDIQAAFYVRGLLAYLGDMSHPMTPRFRWVVAESSPPYCVSVVELSDADMQAANFAVDGAIDLWNKCLNGNWWPGYKSEPHIAVRPGWATREDAWSTVDVDESVPF